MPAASAASSTPANVHAFEVEDGERLFPEDDPLAITIPPMKGAEPDTPAAGGRWPLLDRVNPPLEDGYESKPVSYFVELLTCQVGCYDDDCDHEEARATFEASLVWNYERNRITIPKMIALAEGLREAREAAEKGTVARRVDRPTSGRRRSTR